MHLIVKSQFVFWQRWQATVAPPERVRTAAGWFFYMSERWSIDKCNVRHVGTEAQSRPTLKDWHFICMVNRPVAAAAPQRLITSQLLFGFLPYCSVQATVWLFYRWPVPQCEPTLLLCVICFNDQRKQVVLLPTRPRFHTSTSACTVAWDELIIWDGHGGSDASRRRWCPPWVD